MANSNISVEYFKEMKNHIFLFSVLIALETIMIESKPFNDTNTFAYQIGLLSVLTLIFIIWLKLFFRAYFIYDNLKIESITSIFHGIDIILFSLFLLPPIIALFISIYNIDKINFWGCICDILFFALFFIGILFLKYCRKNLLTKCDKCSALLISSITVTILACILYITFQQPIHINDISEFELWFNQLMMFRVFLILFIALYSVFIFTLFTPIKALKIR